MGREVEPHEKPCGFVMFIVICDSNQAIECKASSKYCGFCTNRLTRVAPVHRFAPEPGTGGSVRDVRLLAGAKTPLKRPRYPHPVTLGRLIRRPITPGLAALFAPLTVVDGVA